MLQLAEELSLGPAASDQTIAQLKSCGFDDAAIVELVLTASFYVCVGRFLQTMDIELEPGYGALVERMNLPMQPAVSRSA